MHVHCLHCLKSTGLLSWNAFCQPCKSTTGEMVPKEGSNLAVGPDMTPCVCTRLSEKNLAKTSHCLLVRLVVQKLIDNCYYFMLSE